MINTITLLPGVTFRCFQDTRFKQGCLSIQFVRPMRKEEAALNALVPSILLRGCAGAEDLRAITLKLDDLYGASVGAIVRLKPSVYKRLEHESATACLLHNEPTSCICPARLSSSGT